MRLRWFLVLLLVLAAPLRAALADDFELPGLQADSDAYASSLTGRNPAGGTPQQRRQAETQAADAIRRKDWNAAAAALEARVAAGEATPDQWLQLAQAQLRRSPPDPKKALAAAWQNFQAADAGAPEIPSLLVMTDALRLLDRPAQMVQTLEAVLERAPDNADYRRMLADARRATGLLVRRVQSEPEAVPPRACLEFTVAPVRRDDFHPQDWVRLDPAIPGAAVTREGDQICVSGLPSGATTRITLRAGMPAEDGLSLLRETTLAVAMANRQPRIIFDTRLFVLPRYAATKLTMTTVNLSSVKLKLVRLTERNTVGFTAENPLGQPVNGYAADNLLGETVWEGGADIPGWQPNQLVRIALPLPDALQSAGPGLYALRAAPGDGTPGDSDSRTAVQMILRTDLAPTVWRGADGLTLQIRGFADARPKPGVQLQLLAHDNDILASATTDADGMARFAAPLLRGKGPMAPQAVHAFVPDPDGKGGDFTTIDLTTAAFDLSDRGTEGQADPGPQDAYLWTDRGIYRPGETVQLMALLRDGTGNPLELPVQVTVRRPNGQVYLTSPAERTPDASLHLAVALSPTAPAGSWTLEVRTDPAAKDPVGSVGFRVDAFVPDRMAVDLGPAKGPIVAGTPYDLPVAARFLYGAPGAGLSGKASLQLLFDDAPFPALAGYAVGLAGEAYAPDRRDLDLPDTDAQGHAALRIALARVPDTTHPLKAEIEVTVDDPSGRGSRARTTIPIRPAGHLLGIKPGFADGAVDAGAPAGFDIVAVDADGQRVGTPAKLRLVRERPDWRLVIHGQLASYETVWRDEPLETAEIAIPAGAPLHYAKSLEFGRYRLEVTEAGGLAATSVRFRSGWAVSNDPDVPDKADVSADRRAYTPGDTARIHIAAPFAGEATVLVAGSRVFSVRSLPVAASGTDVDLPVDAAWGPGAYALVHVFRPGQLAADPNARPGRAIGVAWLDIDPATRRLDVKVDAAERYAPRGRVTIPVRTAPGSWISLAAVDEGVLRLTGFQSPDPGPHFLGRRTLALDIRDQWGRLIPPAEGAATALRQGGDASFVLPEIPQKVVALFTSPMQAGADGVVQVPLDLPDFNGQIRLMAVAWQGNRVGAGQADIIVRDPLVAEALLPRFLAPGDQARLGVLLHDLDLPAGQATVDLTTEGPLQITGATHLAATLAAGVQAVPNTVLTATGVGRGVIRLDVAGPSGFHVQHESAIIVRPARGAVVTASGAELAPGAQAALALQPDRYVPGTWSAAARFGGPVRYDPTALVRALEDYPLNCLEQATSKGFPLVMLPDGAAPNGQLQRALEAVLDRQRYDGGFGLWSASDDADPWLSAYATEFLLRARDAGAPVPEQALKDAVSYLSDRADEDDAVYDGTAKPEEMAAGVYRLYDLARAGSGRPGAARVLAEHLDKLPTPLARAQLGAALALAHDQPRAEAAFAAALEAPARKWWMADYGTALRDQAAIAVLLRESGLLPDRLASLIAALPGADLDPKSLDTQEQAWTAAAAAVLGRGGQPARIVLDGQPLAAAPVVTVALSRDMQARNAGDRPVWESLSVTGVPREAPPAARSQMRITRRFLAMDGSPLDLDHLRQNTVFVLVLEGRAEDGQEHRAMVLHGLPAGWEIAGRFGAGDAPGLSWLKDLSETQAQPAGDDRFAAVVDLTGEKPSFRVAIKLRAVTPGTFELPGAEVADMYRPALYARQAAGRISVQAAE